MKIFAKFFKCILITFILVCVFFVLAEIISFSVKITDLAKEGCFKDKSRKETIKSISNYYTEMYKKLNDLPFEINEIRKPIIKNNNPSIILLGCSYTYGYNLKDNESFDAVLSDYTNKTVYNLGINSSSPRESLYILQHKDILEKLIKDKNNVEYIIYTYIPDHVFRLYYNLNEFSPIYKIKNNSELIYKKNNLYNATFFSREVQRLKYRFSTKEQKNNLFALYITEINKEIKNNFKFKDKNTKFVIFVFIDKSLSDWEKIAKIDDNIIIVHIKDIFNGDISDYKYTISKDDPHPNTEAWKVIVPKLMKHLDEINNK